MSGVLECPAQRLADLTVVRRIGDRHHLAGGWIRNAEHPQHGAAFGRERLVEAVKENYDRPARELIASLEMAVLEWTANAGANDDVTFFVIKALK